MATFRRERSRRRNGTQKERAPRSFAARGCEPQAACTDRPWRRERGPATGTCLHKGRAVCKNEEAPCLVGRGPRESSSDLLSRARRPGTIGDEGLDFRVRKGNGYDPLSVTAETNSWRHSVEKVYRTAFFEAMVKPGCPRNACRTGSSKKRKSSTGLLVPLGSTCRHAHTCGLSTS